MPVYREVGLESLAFYQQALRTAERIKTLRREIDDVNRELYERLDDLDIIIEKFKTTRLGARKDLKKSRPGVRRHGYCRRRDTRHRRSQLASSAGEASAPRMSKRGAQAGTAAAADKVDYLQGLRKADADWRGRSRRRARSCWNLGSTGRS